MKRCLLLISFSLFLSQLISAQSLIHYWNFNVTGSEASHLAPAFTVGGGSIAYIAGGTSVNDFANGTGQNFNILNLNARNGDPSGNHMRINNPIGSSLAYSLPTTGFSDVVFKYATRRSGSGAGVQKIEYSVDGTNFIAFATILPNDGDPTLQTLDFSAIAASDDNANFKIRFGFEQGGGGTVGNNRFDNATLEGTPTGADNIPPSVSFAPINAAIDIAVNVNPVITFSEAVRRIDNSPIDNSNAATLVILKINNATGSDVPFTATVSGNAITIVPSVSLANNQQYYIAVKPNVVEDISDNAIATERPSTFTTIATQSVLSAGDILFVAYQMNSIPNNDRFAFVTFVNILGGTKINFTDAKYTVNTPAQCPGGFTWTAPAAGLPAGSVVTIFNDALTADAGTLTGSGFGLSANGDQIIAYTGVNTSPNFLTAFSSNAWVAGNTSCSGSISSLPAGLAEGVSSVNLSTTTGNVAGNTANAFYSGSMNGSTAFLKTQITNPANWTGAASGTPAQTWPAWAFPGPPVVISASTISNTSIRIVFNRDLDPVSATNLSNFTGIPNLLSVTRTDNGALADTLILTYGAPFTNGTPYTLTVSGVKDAENRSIYAPYVFNFTYNTSIGFKVATLSISETSGQAVIELTFNNPSPSSVDLQVKTAFSTATGGNDFQLSSQTLTFNGSSTTTQTITVPIVNDAVNEQDEYFVLTLENPAGLALGTNKSITVFIRDDERKAPVPTKAIELNYIGSYDPSGASNASSEIVAYDSASKRLFIISALQDRLDIADFSNPAAITPVTSVNMTSYGGITSVAVRNGIVAVASPNANEQLNGSVVFFDINGNFQKQVTVGALPDMIVFTKDGKKVLTANEGQPNDSYTVDPEGSVSIINIEGGIPALTQNQVTTLDFTSFNAQANALIAAGVRKGFPGSTLSQDLEPEYIAFSEDSKKAWVIMQEANAFAVIDLTTNTITEIWPAGKKDHSLPGNGFDASDLGTEVHIANWPVKGLYMPDGIATYQVNGTTYIVGANEGDDREYSAFNERVRVNAASYILDSAKFPNAAILKQDNNLGRLRVTRASGDTDGDGDFDEIHLIGGRSFSIWNTNTKSVVYDSQDDFEQYTAKTPLYSGIFNADHESNTRKSRSSSKGPEPEGLVIAPISGKQYAFSSLERVGGVMVYDITDPANVQFVDYNNPRNLNSYGGDNGPEGILHISNTASPDSNHYILVANEVSGSISIYRLTSNNPNQAPVVSLTNPLDNATYKAGDDVTVSAVATDVDGFVKRVEFFYIYNNTTFSLGSDSTAPFEVRVNDVEPGNFLVFAKATDSDSAVAISDSIHAVVTGCEGSGAITVEAFANIPGGAVSNLTSHPSYPASPTVVTQLDKMETPDNLADDYGLRMRGYICAPMTGNYTFYIASDEQSELWLSTDDQPANRIKIAFLQTAVSPRNWTAFTSQKSQPILLIRGARYYIEVLHKESMGTDNLAVGWVRPDGQEEGPITGQYLSPYPLGLGGASGDNGSVLRDALNESTGLQVLATPNPSADKFSLIINSGDSKGVTVTVRDINGRTHERYNQVPSNGTLRLGASLRPGIYFAEVVQGSHRKVVKLIKQ
ncbi:MAG: choice-of-anchor I family protein [Gemmatimonadaceae bacterium]|nr:choice-of-anchor I family protein [Chitinophagaceae bacterium]